MFRLSVNNFFFPFLNTCYGLGAVLSTEVERDSLGPSPARCCLWCGRDARCSSSHSKINTAWKLLAVGSGPGGGRRGAWELGHVASELGLCTNKRSDLSGCLFIFFYSAHLNTFKKTQLFSFYFMHNMRLLTSKIQLCDPFHELFHPIKWSFHSGHIPLVHCSQRPCILEQGGGGLRSKPQ